MILSTQSYFNKAFRARTNWLGYHLKLNSRGYSSSSSICYLAGLASSSFSPSASIFFWASSPLLFLRAASLRSMNLPQERLTHLVSQFSISWRGTPCMPKTLRAMLSRPWLAAGTVSMVWLCWERACWIMESMEENFLGHLGQQKCLAFWWWCRITSFLKARSQQKQNGFSPVMSLRFRPIPLLIYTIFTLYTPMPDQPTPDETTHAGFTLKMVEESRSMLLQTDRLALEAIFSSPVLEVMNYIEQTEKYSYRAALSGLNLKLEEFDEYYSLQKGRIEDAYFAYAFRSMEMVQNLLVTLKLAKVMLWREQTAIANNLRNHLFSEKVDPYCFQPEQFKGDYKQVTRTLTAPRSQLKQSLATIKECSDRMREVEGERMDAMFGGRVEQPFTTSNKRGVEVNPSGLFASLLDNLRVRMEKSEESIPRRHFQIHEEIMKLGKSFCDYSLKKHTIAQSVIKKYNETSSKPYQRYSIVQPLHLEGKKQQFVNADDLCSGKQSQSDTKPALANRQLKLTFSNSHRVLDQQTGREEVVEQLENEQGRREWRQISSMGLVIKESPFELFAQRRRYNPKEFYQHRQFLKQRQRDEESREWQHRDEHKDLKLIYRRVYRAHTCSAVPWTDIADSAAPVIKMYEKYCEKEEGLWEETLKEEAMAYHYGYREHSPKKKEEESEKPTPEQLEAEAIARQHEAFTFQKRRREEELVRLRQLGESMQARSYDKYMKMVKLQAKIGGSFIGVGGLCRYGVNLQMDMSENALPDADAFLFNYYRERYYRQHASVVENADNPIIFMDSRKVSMNSAPKIVSSLISSVAKRANSLSFFLVWSHDLIGFRRSSNGKSATIEVYPYHGTDNANKLVYELKRRLYLSVESHVYDYTTDQPVEEIYSKAETAHRLVFDRHRPLPNLRESVAKGREIMDEIMQDLRTRTN